MDAVDRVECGPGKAHAFSSQLGLQHAQETRDSRRISFRMTCTKSPARHNASGGEAHDSATTASFEAEQANLLIIARAKTPPRLSMA